MASELTITDVFPMRKRRALRLGNSTQSKSHGNSNWGQKKPDASLLKTPSSKLSSKKPGKSPVGRGDKQQPLCTPTRLNQSPSIALGRLRKTPQRLAAWRHLSPYDSGPEIVWDNDGHCPASTFSKGNRRELYGNKTAQDHLTSLIRKISKDSRNAQDREVNFFDDWMRKEEGECIGSLKSTDEGCKKKSRTFLRRTDMEESSRPAIQRMARKRSRVTSCMVKIKEELSNFIKDINENISDDIESPKDMLADVKTELVQDVCPMGNNAKEERETSCQIEKSDDIFLLEEQQQQQQQQKKQQQQLQEKQEQPQDQQQQQELVDVESFEDGNWLGSEKFLREFSGHEIGEGDGIKNPVARTSKRIVGTFKEKVDTALCAAGEVFVDSRCDRIRKATEPSKGQENDIAFVKKVVAKQPEGLRVGAVIRQETADVECVSRSERGRKNMVDNLPNSVPPFSEKHPAVNESVYAINEKGKHRPLAVLCTDVCKVGAKKTELRNEEKQTLCSREKEGCNSKCKSGKFEQVTEKFGVEGANAISEKGANAINEKGANAINEKGAENLNGKERLDPGFGKVKPLPDFNEDELSELLDKDDEFIFDEIDNVQNAVRTGNVDTVDGMIKGCDLGDRDFEEGLLLIEDAGNGDGALKGSSCKHPINSNDCAIDLEKKQLAGKGSKEIVEDLFEFDSVLDEIDFDDCADLVDDRRLIACGREQSSRGGSGNVKISVDRTACKSISETNRKGSICDMNSVCIGNVASSLGNKQKCRTLDGRKGRSYATGTAACQIRQQTATENNLNAECENRGLVVNKKCSVQTAKIKARTFQSLEATRKALEFRDFEISNIDKCPDDYFADICFNEQELPASGFADTVHGCKSKINDIDSKLIDTDLDWEDWNDDFVVQSDQLSNGRPDKWGAGDRVGAKVLSSNAKHDCKMTAAEKKESLKNQARHNEGRRNLNWDLSRIQGLKTQRSELRQPNNEYMHEQEKSRFKSMPNRRQQGKTFREKDKIKVNKFTDHCFAVKEKFGSTSLINEGVDQSFELDGDNFWDDGFFPLENAPGPFTSTQKSNSPERGSFPCKEAQPVKITKTYSAAEIERKKADAIKRLEQKQ